MKAIEVEDLHHTYLDGTISLKGVSFSVKVNETFSVIGPNGAGKTTLLLALCGLIPFKGSIKIFDQVLNNRSIKEIRKNLGFVSQDPDDQLFMPNVYDDVAFGPKNLGFPEEEISEIVKEALQVVGLAGFETRSPHHLSFGEKKRVSLATVLSMKPKILLLDEPTSNLDPRSRREFIELLQRVKCTKIIVGHDLDMIVKTSQRVLLLNEGKKIAEGETLDILKNKELLEANGLELPGSF
jgi:cobalt/nickel transport system ATP-binding protein